MSINEMINKWLKWKKTKKAKTTPSVDVTGDGSKVRCCKEQ